MRKIIISAFCFVCLLALSPVIASQRSATSVPYVNQTGAASNLGVGTDALSSLTTGTENAVFGLTASAITIGTANAIFGSSDPSSGRPLSRGNYNSVFGARAMDLVTTGSSNVIMGYLGGALKLRGGSSNNILIGPSLDVTTTNGSNEFHLGSTGDLITVTGLDVPSTSIGTWNGNFNVTGTLKQAGVAVSVNGSLAEQTINFQPGLLTSVTNTKTVFAKFVKTSTVDNLVGSALLFVCAVNPVVTLYECGTTATCDSSPVTIGSVTITAAGQAFDGSLSAPTITAGDYVAFAISAGTCTSLDVAATSQIHAN